MMIFDGDDDLIFTLSAVHNQLCSFSSIDGGDVSISTHDDDDGSLIANGQTLRDRNGD